MDELEAQITDEIAAVTGFLEQKFGRRSRWNGEVEMSDDPTAFGKALWSGRISLNRQLAQTDLRWRTMIHEALHHLSVGLSISDYLGLPDWEEGVVEQLQRLCRNELLTALSVELPNTAFAVVETDHQFNLYINAFEAIRGVIKMPKQDFYQALLATPLKERPGNLIELARLLPASDFRDFQRIVAASFSTLRGD